MKRSRPRLLLWLLSISCILWMAATAAGAHAAGWSGPATSPLVIPAPITALLPSKPAAPAAASLAPAHQAVAAAPVVGSGHLASQPVVAAPTAAPRVHVAPKPASPALNLPAYTPVSTSGNQSFDASTISSLVIKFLIVLALLFIVLRVLKAVLPRMHGEGKSREGALILHSESIGDKQRIVLLDLHGQLVAAGISGGSITPLATIEDPEAMATLRARYTSVGQAVPGYRESTAAPALGRSFVEALKRAGIAGAAQDQSSNPPAAPRPVLSMPFLQRTASRSTTEDGTATPRPSRRVSSGRRRAVGQTPEPILQETLEAMRGIRRQVESS